MVNIIDNFLSDTEFSKAWDEIKNIKWKKQCSINRVEINLPWLKRKLCWGEDEDYFSYVTRMDEKLNASQKWHKDISSPLKLKPGQVYTENIAQWLIYMGGDFTGGILQTRSGDIEPKTNRFVLLDPFEEEHNVTRVSGFRYALGGFLYKYKEEQ